MLSESQPHSSVENLPASITFGVATATNVGLGSPVDCAIRRIEPSDKTEQNTG